MEEFDELYREESRVMCERWNGFYPLLKLDVNKNWKYPTLVSLLKFFQRGMKNIFVKNHFKHSSKTTSFFDYLMKLFLTVDWDDELYLNEDGEINDLYERMRESMGHFISTLLEVNPRKFSNRIDFENSTKLSKLICEETWVKKRFLFHIVCRIFRNTLDCEYIPLDLPTRVLCIVRSTRDWDDIHDFDISMSVIRDLIYFNETLASYFIENLDSGDLLFYRFLMKHKRMKSLLVHPSKFEFELFAGSTMYILGMLFPEDPELHYYGLLMDETCETKERKLDYGGIRDIEKKILDTTKRGFSDEEFEILSELERNIDENEHYFEPIMELLENRVEFESKVISKIDPSMFLSYSAIHSNFCVRLSCLYLSCCSACGETLVKLKQCSRCKLVSYCSERCQITDWKKGHKKDCFESVNNFDLSSSSSNKKRKKKRKRRRKKSTKKCHLCRRKRKSLRRCSRCKKVVYCGVMCQKFDWERHKKECL